MAVLIRHTCGVEGCGQPVTSGKVLDAHGRKVAGNVHVFEKQGVAATHKVEKVIVTVLTENL
jgi:hypothetical protein